MSESSTIRPAALDDSPRLAELCGVLGYPAEPQEFAVRLGRVLSRSEDIVLLAEIGPGRIVGWVHAAVQELLKSDQQCEILGLVVAAEHRGQDVGRSLLTAVEAWARHRRLELLTVRSNIVRLESHPFYQRLGFTRVKTQHLPQAPVCRRTQGRLRMCSGRARQRSQWWLRLVLIAAACETTAVMALAQHDHGQPVLPDAFRQPMPLYPRPEVLGAFTRPLSSSTVDAQRYFDQGFQLMFAFDKYGAIRSFREAEKRAPDCAMCYWGEAWAWGSFLNGPMSPDNAPFAFAALQQALKLVSDRETPVERALIDAMSRRYVEHFDPDKRRDQDTAYAEAMRAVHERFPKDLEVGTLYGEALFLLEPRRGSRDINAPNVQRILRAFEDVLTIDPTHVGACHLYIHLTEATTEPQRAEKCADAIGNAIPGASHLNHMPSHTWNLLGRWGDSVRANLQAWQSDQKAAVGQGVAVYPSHDLHMLAFAASMDGQGAIAVQAAKDYTKFDTSMFHILTLVRFGRFDDIQELSKRPESNDIAAAVWDFGQGYARLRAGEKDVARTSLKRIVATSETSKAMFRVHNAHDLLGVLAPILEGEIDRADGSLDRAIAAFNRSVAQYDALMYDEPEPFPFSPRHWLGAALLEARRYAEAERVYRDDLRKHPHNGWSLVGLKAALESQGKPLTDVEKDFEASWARADTWIHASRF